MQGVQGILKSGAARLAACEGYSTLGRCPECRGSLISAGEEGGGELVCSFCGIVAGRANSASEDGSSAPSVSKNEPLGSFILADASATPSLRSPAFGWARLMPNVIGRGGPLLACSRLTERISERLMLPKSVMQNANLTARRLLPGRMTYGASIPAISAYSLLHACRSAGIARIGHREILAAYTDAGYKVGKGKLLRIGLESPVQLPRANTEELLRAAVGRLQSSESVVARLRKVDLDPKAYFTRLLELAREIAAESSELRGFSPRTVATGSVYVASLAMSVKTFTQREAGETLGMAEYSVREFCCRTRHDRMEVEAKVWVRPVKSGPRLRRA